jgi:hypothetical protein
MKKQKLLLMFLFLLLGALLFCACQKEIQCSSPKESYYKIAADEIAAIPYKDNDTIVLIKTNTNDTFTFYANKWQYGYYRSATQTECYNYENRESRAINFYNINLNTIIKIEQYIPQNSEYTSTLSIGFKGTSFLEYSSYIANHKPQLLELIVKNRIFQNVYYFDNSFSLGTKNYKCYYTKEYGIIKMEMGNDEIWELLSYKK